MNQKECQEKQHTVKKTVHMCLLGYIFSMASPQIMIEMSLEVKRILQMLYSEDLSTEEKNEIIIEVLCQTDGSITITGKNFFTVLLLQGIYIPYFLTKYKDTICHPSCGTIKYSEGKTISRMNLWNYED
jgi:hypothetical protein